MIDLLHAEAVTCPRNQNPVLLAAFDAWCNEFVPALLDELREARGTINILADRLARYTGGTVPGEIRSAASYREDEPYEPPHSVGHMDRQSFTSRTDRHRYGKNIEE